VIKKIEECKANFTLDKTEFNSSETVNYTIEMKNEGKYLSNMDFSINSEITTNKKPLSPAFLIKGNTTDLNFDFTTPNTTEDRNYTFTLNVSSSECSFSLPFQITVKKSDILKQNITTQNETKNEVMKEAGETVDKKEIEELGFMKILLIIILSQIAFSVFAYLLYKKKKKKEIEKWREKMKAKSKYY